MSAQKNNPKVWITYLGIVIAIVSALLWSVSLVSRGIWRLTHQEKIEIDRPNPTQVASSDLDTSPQMIENFAEVENVAIGSFRYAGSPAWARIRLLVDSVIQAERPEFQLRYVQTPQNDSATNTEFEMLLAGKLSFLQSSYPLQERDYQRAEQLGIKLKQIPVAIDAIAIAVNPELNISGLTIDQLEAIYSGKITNWQQVGGPDLAIVPYSRPVETGDTVEFFREYVLKSQDLATNVKLVSSTTEALRLVAENRGAIYYESASLIVPQCSIKTLPIGLVSGEFVAPYRDNLVTSDRCPEQRNQINIEAFRNRSYILTRYLYVTYQENSGSDDRAALTYANLLLTERGQELIARAGFVPLR